MSALIDSASVSGTVADAIVGSTQAVRQSVEKILSHATFGTATHAQMVRSPENTRKKPRDLSELLALVRANGVLHNLVCYPEQRDGTPTGKLAVADGDGRWQVVGLLIAEGSLPEDYQILYLLVSEAEAVLVSLAANHGRAPMHPTDIFDAMLKLVRHGRSVADIALAFGLSELTVRQRLKLANVAPRLFALYRDDKASYEQMAALAVSDNHAEQEAAWDSLDDWDRPPHQLRRLLTMQRVPVRTDRVACFVGIKAFERAGGVVERDLFSEQGDGYTEDVALLESLAHAKLQRIAQRLKRERWAWIDVRARLEAAELALYGRVRTVVLPPDAEQAAALAQLDQRAASLNAQLDGDNADDTDDSAVVAELSRIDVERGRIRAALCQPNPADRALAGAVVSIASDGTPCVHRGLIRPEDKGRMAKTGASTAEGGESDGKGRKPRPAHSERLTLLLSAQRTLALRAELVRQPEVALLVLAHRLISGAFYAGERGGSAVQLDARPPVLPEAAHSGSAWEYWEARRAALAAPLPETAGVALMEWLRRQQRPTVDDYIAFCTACAVNGLQTAERSAPEVDALAAAVSLDMHVWWKPTAPDYFAHVNKARMVEVVAQAVSPATAVPLEKMGKDAAAEAAARAVADSGWLPPLFSGTPSPEQDG
jgi:ParB family chromosome partitioning protein